jgi:uncharacterized membrane protein
MDQTVWNVANGHGFTITDSKAAQQLQRSGGHADFLLILLAPVYYIWSDPKALLVIQVVTLGFGGFVIYAIAQDVLGSPRTRMVFAAAYVLYPAIQKLTLQDFHAEVLSIPLFLIAFWALQKNKSLLFILFSFLAGLGKEQIWLVVVFLGVYAMVFTKQKIAGLLTVVIGLCMFMLIFWFIIPRNSPAGQHWALSYLSMYGNTQNQIILGMIRNPMRVIHDFFGNDRLFYYFQLLFPVGFLSLLAPQILLISLPNLLINSLSNDQFMRIIDYQYSSSVIPWIFISAIYGYKNVLLLFQKIRTHLHRKFIISVCGMILLSSYVWGELPFEKTSRFFYFTSDQSENALLRRLEKEIGPQFSVSATNNVGAHFSERQYIYYFPLNAQSVDYVIAKLGDQYAWPSGDEQFAKVTALFHNPQYELFAQDGNVYAFRKIKLSDIPKEIFLEKSGHGKNK